MSRLILIVVLLLLASAMSLVVSQYQARRLFVDLERARSDARTLEVEWNQLQLEQSRLAKHALIDLAARKVLGMRPVVPERTLFLSVDGGEH
ncbi:MAG: cell division protein FtsL [Burkholderiales bacterium]|nr:MAG: cell division protein FtsL [Burkholderiales bacterium]